jgi:rod shape-determining protein MreB
LWHISCSNNYSSHDGDNPKAFPHEEIRMLFAPMAGLFSSELAIDLGTANTMVYTKRQGIVAHEPSVVALQARHDGTHVALGIGHAAKEMLGKAPANVSLVHPLREGVVADCDLTQLLVRHVMKKVTGHSMLRHVRVIVGVPSDSSSIEKRAVVEPLEAAGAREVYLIDEPMAAALGAGLDIRRPYGHLVVDIGGGTTDIAVISLADTVYSHTLRLGGNTMDAAVANMLRQKYDLTIGLPTAEQLKITVGSALPRQTKGYGVAKGIHAITGAPQLVEVSAYDVSDALFDTLETIVMAIREAVDTTPPELVADIAETGVVFTGGGALLDGLAGYMQKELGFPVHVAANPMTCVAVGAGQALADADLRQHLTRRV